MIQELSFIKKGNENVKYYLEEFGCFDSETSHDLEKSWIYIWGFYFNGQYISRRTPAKFISLLEYYKDKYCLGKRNKEEPERVMVIYVHNLWFDLRHIIRFIEESELCDTEGEVFAIDSQKVLTYRIDGFEFRDSYLLANRSLDNWGKTLNVEHKKKTGTIDYTVKRFPDTKLKKSVKLYQKYDLLSLYECIKLQMEMYGDTITTIPLTSTGYVRRECRNACKRDKGYRKFFNSLKLTLRQYKLCHEAFAGGITHANRFIVAKTVKGKIRHFDKKSFYPSTQMLEYFPVTGFHYYYNYDYDGFQEISFFEDVLTTKCCIMKIYMEDVHIKSESITCPYLQFSKVIGNKGACIQDNGRIIHMKGYGIMCLTELDLDILQRQYSFGTIRILEMHIADRGEFPAPLKECVLEFFEKKEKLQKEIIDYIKSKNSLNSIFGMSVTAIIRDIIKYDIANGKFKKVKPSNEECKEQLNKFYSNYNSFMPYQLGIYVTAHCRHELINLIEQIGYDKFLYCDTDSIFWIADESDKDIELINEHNNYQIERNKKQNIHVVNRNHELSYFDTFENENDNIVEFRTLHSKCYAFNDRDGILHVTIAGVSKRAVDGTTSADELGHIDNLKDGFTFVKCGGTISKYVSHAITTEYIDGHYVEYADGVIIENTTKEISEMPQEYMEFFEEG